MKIFFLSLVLPFLVHAQNYVGAVSSATGKTGRAAVETTDSAYLNPASLAYLKGYVFTTSYSSGVSASTSASSVDYSVSLMDNLKDTVVPTALAYTQMKQNSLNYDRTIRDFRLSFGNFVRQGFALGLGLHYQDDQFPALRFQQSNLNLGMIYAFDNNLGVGISMEDVIDPKADLPKDVRQQSTTGIGISYTYRSFARMRADLVSASGNRFTKPTLGMGLESYMNKWLVTRIGFSRNFDEETNLYTAGLGFKGPKFGLHYAYLSSPQEAKLTRHSIDLAVPLW